MLNSVFALVGVELLSLAFKNIVQTQIQIDPYYQQQTCTNM